MSWFRWSSRTITCTMMYSVRDDIKVIKYRMRNRLICGTNERCGERRWCLYNAGIWCGLSHSLPLCGALRWLWVKPSAAPVSPWSTALVVFIFNHSISESCFQASFPGSTISVFLVSSRSIPGIAPCITIRISIALYRLVRQSAQSRVAQTPILRCCHFWKQLKTVILLCKMTAVFSVCRCSDF